MEALLPVTFGYFNIVASLPVTFGYLNIVASLPVTFGYFVFILKQTVLISVRPSVL